jgi:transposase
LIAAVNGNNVLAQMCLKGTTNTELFVYWLEHFIVPVLKPNQVVIMDNASIHKSKKVRKLIESVGAKLVYLPPYAPHLNIIEHYWVNLKKFVAKIRHKFTSFQEALDFAFSQNNTALTF